MNNIDEDIEILKEHIKELEEKIEQIKVLENNNRVLDISLGRELETHKDTNKELEKYKKAYELETYERQKFIDELDTWKKIAEFMADFINMYTLSGEENQYCHRVIDCQEIGGSRSCIECIIDWARKEVEKNV